MTSSRKLRLSREPLNELVTDELRSVAGGTHVTCALTDACTHGCIVAATISPACLSIDLVQCFNHTRQLSCGCQPSDSC